MKKICLALSGLVVALSGTAYGAEFQPMGALGIGGAGVARTYDSNAPYWNPAGLAFNDKSFSSRIDASVGLKVNEGLAENIDRLSDMDFDQFSDYSAGATKAAVNDTMKAISILQDISDKKGTLAVEGNAVLGFQIKHLAFGAYGTFEGFAKPEPDTVNILPTITTAGVTTPVTRNDIATPVAGSAASNLFFSQQQRTDIQTALTTNGFTANQAQDLINATDANLAGSGISSQAATTALINYGNTFTNPDSKILDNNTTTVLTKGLAYVEFPISYGHPVDLGSFGKIGIGATAKVITGRVYQTQTFLLKSGTSIDSSDIVKEMNDNYQDTTTFGFDLGALWRPTDWINVGIVAKNLNSPKFDGPNLKDKNGAAIAGSGGSVTLKPQVRMGVALDPLSWLTLAADLDLSENETVLSSNNYKSRNIGGGFEWHYFSWFKFRGGMYSNIAEKGIGPTATAGLTLGTKWINLDIDGAYGLETAKYDEKSYPQEARVQAQINFLF